MSWTNRVLWQEGMFLRAQHFQQQDRWVEALVQGRAGMLRPYPWGLTSFAIDRNLLGTGRFALASGAGVFEDGTLFVLPGETDHPAPLEPPPTARNALVYLALPVGQAGAAEVDFDEAGEGRYGIRSFEAYDTQPRSRADAPQPGELQVGRLRLRYMLESQERAGYHCIALARIIEVEADRRITLDDRWIPPVLMCSAAPPLIGLLAELTGMLNQRGEALASRLSAPGARGVAEVQDFLLLQTVNRWQKLLSHWAEAGNVHPEDVYAVLVQIAGELATFTEATRRPGTYPAYRHEDLHRSFAPVVADLRRSLSAVLETTAVAIPLQERRHGVRVGPLTDRSLLRNANFVLSVQADVPAETLRRLFPSQAKIGAVEHITNLVNVALPGIAIRPLSVAPRQIPFYAGATYFELDRASPHWQQMQSSGGFAIFVSGEFPNLQMELWAIRGSEGG
jgi:type VI secretion system protein ImpJ